jgi:thiaminase
MSALPPIATSIAFFGLSALGHSTPAREAELIAIFKEATRLEIELWEMGWRAGQHGE